MLLRFIQIAANNYSCTSCSKKYPSHLLVEGLASLIDLLQFESQSFDLGIFEMQQLLQFLNLQAQKLQQESTLEGFIHMRIVAATA